MEGMKKALPSGSIRANTRWTHAVLFSILAVLGLFSLFQARLWRMAGTSATTLETNLSQAMQARLNAVSVQMLNYLQTQNPKALEQVKAQSLSAQELFSQFKRESSPSLSETMNQVEAAHDTQREAVMTLLVADSSVQDARVVFERRQQALIDTLDRQLMGTMKGAMLQGGNRTRSLLEAAADAKSMRLDYRTDGSPMPQFARIRQNMLDFRGNSSARQAPLIDEALRQLNTVITTAGQWNVQEQAKRDALQKLVQTRAGLDEALEEYARASRGMLSGKTATRQTYVMGFGLGFVGLMFIIAAAAVLWRMQRQAEDQFLQPLLDLTRCMESAASGDLSRLPAPAHTDELGRLSQAIHRAISVMTRSENLVYHLAALVETSGDAIISQSLDGTILSWNKGAQRLYGYSAEEVKGKSISLISPQDGGYQLRGLLQCVARGEKIPAFEAAHQAKNGRSVNAFVKVAAIYDSTRKIIGASLCAQELQPLIASDGQGTNRRQLPSS